MVDCGLRREGRDEVRDEKKSLLEVSSPLLLLLLLSLKGAGNLNRGLEEDCCSLMVVLDLVNRLVDDGVGWC